MDGARREERGDFKIGMRPQISEGGRKMIEGEQERQASPKSPWEMEIKEGWVKAERGGLKRSSRKKQERKGGEREGRGRYLNASLTE